MRLYNTLTGCIEPLTTVRPGEVRMYACGLTVSDDAHLGHGRSGAIFDLLRRVLRTRGMRIVDVRNVTDVDDKIIARARALGQDPVELAKRYVARHDEDMERLRVPRADVEPRASDHIHEVIDFIAALVAREAAYEKEGVVYFRLAAYPAFGELARARGVPVEEEDFVLWKPSEDDDPGWSSPWGRGRPGWHIECSAMSAALLGETFDIHGGGADLLHPHHDAEIAQCHARCGKAPARMFVHNGLVLLADEKMSKSIGNFFTLREIFARYDPAAVRYYLFRTHYREPVTFSTEALDDAEQAIARIEAFMAAAARVVGPGEHATGSEEEKRLLERARTARADVIAALEDDLDTPRALGVVDDLVARGQDYLRTRTAEPHVLGQIEEVLDSIDELFDLRPERARTESRTAELIEAVLRVRKRLRQRGIEDLSAARTASELTEMLRKLGIELVDTRWGTRWRWE